MLYGNAKQFQLYDRLLIDEKNWKIEDMVLEAAKALKKHVCEKKRMVIFCGKGNNGADGLALATLLQKNVKVYLLGNENELSESCHFYLKKVQDLNICVRQDLLLLKEDLNQTDIIIDGIFGTGFKGALNEDVLEIVSMINLYKKEKEIISIDIPSGLQADLGIVGNLAVKADKTITFMAMKLGFLNPECLEFIGEVIVEDILHDDDLIEYVGFCRLLEKEEIETLLKKRYYNGYKGTYGFLSCMVGSIEYPGAALISVGAALHTGCGFVGYEGENSIKNIMIPHYPEVIYQSSQHKKDAILFGCGKGWNEHTSLQLKTLIETSTIPMLIDADGINCLSDHLEWIKNKKAPLVLTPHVGEMKRLLDGDAVLSAIKFAKDFNVIVVLKGPHTLVTDGKRNLRIPSGNKAMAVAGMGDCLAGIIASLLAQHYDAFEAALLGCYIHGCCGDEMAKDNYTVLPSQMLKIIPKIMKDIEKRIEID